MKWFLDVFLPSLRERALNNNNPKYKNSLILSEKQADICMRYMNFVQCHGDYGYFGIYELNTEEWNYMFQKRGKYSIFYVSEVA